MHLRLDERKSRKISNYTLNDLILIHKFSVQTGYLGLIGGLNVKSCTAAVMKAVMTTDLACAFNFCGHRGKHSFAALQLKEVVCGWFFCAFSLTSFLESGLCDQQFM